ncbi:oligosaccharide flippase family protein [Kineococcus sp. SYSU DK004]|uniref:oligosaccharide flippase family protein n=1 Tax=Kineococcus sp. SYSU DK004 TaxID=3383125 RepID=UPI003D7DB02F
MTGTGTGRAARAIALLSFAEVVGKVATLGLLVYAVRVLDPATFGTFSYALAYGALLAVLPAWGLDPLLVQQVGRDRSRLPDQYAQLLVLRTALAVPVLLVGAVAGLGLRSGDGAGWAMVAMLVTAVAESYAHAPRAVAGVLREQSATALVLVVQRALTAAAACGALALGWGLVGLTTVYTVVTVGGTAVLFALVARRGGRPAWSGLRWRSLRSTSRASVPLGVDALIGMLLLRAHTLLLGWFHGDREVAQYTAPFRLVETVLFVTWAVSRVVYPSMASASSTRALRRTLSSGLSIVGFFFVPYAVLLAVRGYDLLDLLFGEYYADEGATALVVLAAAPLAIGIGMLLSYALVAHGRSDLALWTSVIAGAASLVADVFVLPALAVEGAAITTTAAYALEAVMLVVLIRRTIGAPGLGRALLLPAAATLPAAGAALLPIGVLPALAVAGVVYAAVWWVAARRWQPEEAAVLLQVLPRRRG